MTGSKTKQRFGANIFEWLQAFAVYVAMIAPPYARLDGLPNPYGGSQQ